MGPTSGRMGPVAGIASVCRGVISLPVGYRLPALRVKRISSLPTNGTMTNIARDPLGESEMGGSDLSFRLSLRDLHEADIEGAALRSRPPHA